MPGGPGAGRTDHDLGEPTVQLTRPGSGPPPPDLATGLAARARELGQRPAVTVLSPAGRAEQGFMTLAQWAAKGAHLLQVDHDLGPGDQVLVDVPAGWPLAAVAAAVWWTGAAVRLPGPGAARDVVLAVVHEDRPRPDLDEVLRVGDAVDGSPTAAGDDPVWALEVQAFPDQPPVPAAGPTTTAVVDADGVGHDHAAVIGLLADATGNLGHDVATVGDGPDAAWTTLLHVAARPLVTGRPTVVLRDLPREAADGDRVTAWA